jgi:hypothetical protein
LPVPTGGHPSPPTSQQWEDCLHAATRENWTGGNVDVYQQEQRCVVLFCLSAMLCSVMLCRAVLLFGVFSCDVLCYVVLSCLVL